jgi:hypothetical protein
MSGPAWGLLLRDGGLAVLAAIALGYWLYAGHIIPRLPITTRRANPVFHWLAMTVAALTVLNGILVTVELWLVAR